MLLPRQSILLHFSPPPYSVPLPLLCHKLLLPSCHNRRHILLPLLLLPTLPDLRHHHVRQLSLTQLHCSLAPSLFLSLFLPCPCPFPLCSYSSPVKRVKLEIAIDTDSNCCCCKYNCNCNSYYCPPLLLSLSLFVSLAFNLCALMRYGKYFCC